jgi:kinesin family protein 18/19
VPHEKLLVFDPKDDDDSFFYHGVKQNNRDFTKKTHKDAHFSFDGVFGPEATNQEVFEGTTKAVVDAVLEGFNCSGLLFAIYTIFFVKSN